ncbi:hypothetical protein CIW52_06725 [Mycolicibacterium sp. P9-64]|nr:hypothetical protein CIW52_06725 [Mycolicibacterium sp. P9-64]
MRIGIALRQQRDAIVSSIHLRHNLFTLHGNLTGGAENLRLHADPRNKNLGLPWLLQIERTGRLVGL